MTDEQVELDWMILREKMNDAKYREIIRRLERIEALLLNSDTVEARLTRMEEHMNDADKICSKSIK